MATAAVYRMLPMELRDSDSEPDPFATYGRTRWTFTLHIARLSTSPAGSFQLEVQSAPEDETEYQPAVDFGLIDAAALVTEASPRVSELTLSPTEHWIRARIPVNLTGTFTAELLAAAAFLDPDEPADQQYLTQQVREYDDGRTRLVEQAEADILQLIGRDDYGRLKGLRIGQGDLLEQLKDSIALQAAWVFQREALAKGDADDHKALDDMGRYHPDLGYRLSQIKSSDRELMVWRGR